MFKIEGKHEACKEAVLVRKMSVQTGIANTGSLPNYTDSGDLCWSSSVGVQ